MQLVELAFREVHLRMLAHELFQHILPDDKARQQDSVRHKTVDSVRATRSFTRVSLPQEKKKAIKEQKNARERIAGIWIAGTCIWIAGTCISARAHMT